MKNILPEWLFQNLSRNYNLCDIQELRIRKNQPIQICYKGKMVELKAETGIYQKPLYATSELIEQIVMFATKRSLYAFDEQIKNGYIITENGIRIGLCGTAVVSDGKISLIKKISSLNIRIGHNIADCSSDIIHFIASGQNVKNTLILSN